ncbi:transferase family-domain-containing protein [Xylaria telfairii]|nr:transferase family-domain-containing protein [Xylaria telfairii]
MADLPTPDRLSLGSLDLLMPRTYIRVLFTFRTTESSFSLMTSLQRGLDSLSETIPWLSGRVHPTATTTQHGLEIQYGVDGPGLTLVHKGTIDASYEALSAGGLPPNSIPENIWPVPPMIDEDLFTKGAPVFGASLFSFADGRAVGLCVCMHHNAVDGTAFADIVKLWAQHVAGSPPSYADGERARLIDILRSELEVVSSKKVEALLESHPEYSKTPPALPAEFPPCMCKMFAVPVARIDAYKERLKGSVSAPLSTNTIVCAFVWSAITRARTRRSAGSAHESSRLAMAVDGRRRLGGDFSAPGNPYLGNAVLYSLSHSSVSDLHSESLASLATICDTIAQSQSPTKINSRHMAEVYSLVEQTADYRTIFVGWDLFSSRDLTITSWADLDLYGVAFGSQLGRPDFIRVPGSVADGVGIILPRKRGSGTNDVVEIMVMLRSDDMALLEQDTVWKDFTT